MTLVCNTSVASVKFLMSQNPNTAKVFCPGIIGLRSPPDDMFLEIIPEPASPKPKASKYPILTIAFSRIYVSY